MSDFIDDDFVYNVEGILADPAWFELSIAVWVDMYQEAEDDQGVRYDALLEIHRLVTALIAGLPGPVDGDRS